jgi:perosamine synthetase
MNTIRSERIPVSGPWITDLEISYVTEAVSKAWYSNANMFHERFEKTFCEKIGSRFAVTLPSCTSAIHLALAARGVGPGDEVIVPDVTWIASAAPITYVGATPVFADIEKDTWCLSADSVAQHISPRTKAIIAVDLYGGMVEMDRILEIARKHNVFVIEDAAEAIGSRYNGKNAGTWGDVGTFSFHGSKTVTTGEGGMLITDDESLFRRVLTLRDHGRPPGDRFFRNDEVAYKYKMSSMQAALGLAQMERLEALIERKRQIFRWYADRLGGERDLALNAEPTGTLNSYWMVTAIAHTGVQKEELMRRMLEYNIDTRPFFHPLSSLRAYAGTPSAERATREGSNGYAVSACGINLPSGFQLDESAVDYICGALRRCI